MAHKKPTREVRPESQREISDSFVDPYLPSQGNPNSTTVINRGEHRSFKGDNVKPFNIGLQDLDETIIYYFDNVIRPFVIQNGERIAVPVVYGDAEKWKMMQKDGYYRDKNGKLMAPLISFKRTGFDQVNSLGNKLLDSAYPYNFGVFEKRDGLHFDIDETPQSYQKAASGICNLLTKPEFIEMCRERFHQSSTIISWKTTALEWVKYF